MLLWKCKHPTQYGPRDFSFNQLCRHSYFQFKLYLIFIFLKKANPIFFRYGSKLVGTGKASPGDVIIAFFNILIGSFAMGHATPHVQTMSEGRGAAKKVFETIDKVSYQLLLVPQHDSEQVNYMKSIGSEIRKPV